MVAKEKPKHKEGNEFGYIASHSHVSLSHQEIEEQVLEDKSQDAKKMVDLGELESVYHSGGPLEQDYSKFKS